MAVGDFSQVYCTAKEIELISAQYNLTSELVPLLRNLGRPRIGVIGDLMLDEYVWGEVERISPEAPIPVLRVSRRQFRAGGAGSVVVNLAQLGAHVSVFSLLGRDKPGEQVRQIFAEEGCQLSGLISDEARRTTLKTRHMGFVQQAHRAVQQILRVDEEERQPIGDRVVDALLARLEAEIDDLEVILISDYSKGLIQKKLVKGILELAGDKPVLADPAGIEDYSLYKGLHLICPNRFEAEKATGISCDRLQDCRKAGAKLLKRLKLRAVAITLDREGILLCETGAEPKHFPTRARVVADVAGAGDMVLSVLGLVIAAGGPLHRAVQLANFAAGMEVRHFGVTPITRDDLLQELRYEGHPAAGKIKLLGELSTLIEEAKQKGRRIAFTNGCFDCLHLGHHHLLHGARKEGDLLVVAVNSDRSVRRLKGATRPQISQGERVRMLADLEMVDYVIVFDDDTPNRLLETLRPDVLVKGSEYRDGVVVGHEIVEGYGGRIAFVQQVPGISTTAILERGLLGEG